MAGNGNPKSDKGKPAWSFADELDALARALETTPVFKDRRLNDYALVMLATSLLDKYLAYVFLLQFRGPDGDDFVTKTMWESVFEGSNAPLSSFSSKIDLGSAMGLFLEDERHDLRVLKGIRNKFAHSAEKLSLAGMAQCRSLKLRAVYPIPKDKNPERDAFKQSCAELLHRFGVSAIFSLARTLVTGHRRDEVRKYADLFVIAARDGTLNPEEAVWRPLVHLRIGQTGKKRKLPPQRVRQ
jgi:hypothetical protein